MSLRRAGCLVLLAAVSAILLTADSAECITIRPAAFDHITASVPKEVMAGVEFEVAVTFVDRFGNPMGQNWKPDTSLTLKVSQSASVRPSVLTPENYLPGFIFGVRTEKMGELTLSLHDDNGNVLDKWNLTIKSGRPVQLLVDLPANAEVGQTVTMSIQAVDAHGNVAFGYVPQAQSMVLENAGASLVGEFKSRAGGIFEMPIQFRSRGRQTVRLTDRKRGLGGSSAAVNVTPAPLASFDIRADSGQAVAGEKLALMIRAVDRYGNPVTDYGGRYKGVRLYSEDAAVAPDLIPPMSFIDGSARVGITLKKAGDHTIRVSELQSNISGDVNVRIVPAGVNTLRVETPESATAGEPFIVTVISEDAFGNRTPSVPSGSVAQLRSTGTGAIAPDTIRSSAFRNGVASLKVTYEKAESFEITAQLADAGKAAPGYKPEDEKERARRSAQKARDEAMRARRESRLRETRVLEKTSPSTGIRTGSPPPAAKKDREPAGKKDPAPARPAPQVKKVTPVETTERQAPVLASKKPMRPGILDSIAVQESQRQALVTFSTNGMTSYNVTTSAKLSRKWIDIEFPDMAVDLPDRIGGGDKIVGEIYVEPSMGDGRGIRVSIEILPTRIGYDVYQEGRSLVLKVSKQ